MLRKFTALMCTAMLLATVYGCIPLLAGAAGGAGTAAWLSGKLTQQFNASYEDTIQAARASLDDMDLELDKETREDDVTQIRSEYADAEVWIDIRRITADSTKVEVRVGGVSPDKEVAERILEGIERNL